MLSLSTLEGKLMITKQERREMQVRNGRKLSRLRVDLPTDNVPLCWLFSPQRGMYAVLLPGQRVR